MKVLIAGCGYVGLQLGTALSKRGHEVFGLRRTDVGPDLAAAGIFPLKGDVTRMEELARLPAGYDWVVNCVAATGGGPTEYRRVYLEGTRNLLAWLSPTPLRKFVYTSSTSVYGQTDGSRVDENSPTEPLAETAQILLETEGLLLKAVREAKFPAVILRLAGIYGPGRGYWFKQFLRNEARIEGTGQRWLNMVHRDDAAGAIIAALERGAPGAIYNAVDDEPVTQIALFRWLAEALGRELPMTLPEEELTARKRGLTNKRVSNRRLRDTLGYEFLYPTFREGFADFPR